MSTKFAVIMVVALLLLAGCSTGKDNGTPNAQPGNGSGGAVLQEIDLIKEGIQLTGYNHDLTLSPDGKKVVFSGYNYDQDTHDLTYKMIVADLVAGKTRVLDDVGSVLTWLEDGQRILYVDNNSIGILDTSTGKKQEIENMRTYAALSPDGKKVAYTLRRPLLRLRHRLFGQRDVLALLNQGAIDLSLCGHQHQPHAHLDGRGRGEICAGSITRNACLSEIAYDPEKDIFRHRNLVFHGDGDPEPQP